MRKSPPGGPNRNSPHAQKERTPAYRWSPCRRNCLGNRPLAPLALLFRRLLLCGLFLWFGLGLCLGFCFLLGSLLCRLLRCRFGSCRPRSGSRRRLRLFFADDQLFLFGLHHFASEFVVFFQPGQLVVFFEIILLEIHSILPWGNPPRWFGAGCCAAGVNSCSNACAVVIALAESCQAFC